MKVIQALPAFRFGDAVGNNAAAIDRILKEEGIDSSIYAENIDPKTSVDLVKPFSELPKLGDKDIFIYHFATSFYRDLRSYGGKLVFQYHNITPPDFFSAYDQNLVSVCTESLSELKAYNMAPILCWAVSEYNRQDLIKAGYICPIHTVPILVPFEDYAKPADDKVLEQYDDDYINFLFVGRIVPNKAFEDVISIFAWYQKHVNAKSRLFLVGNDSMSIYVGRLKRYIGALGVQNVVFPGLISFNAILAYYQLADIFLCMSKHEGFCVPLLEAMYFHIPIIARKTTAIPYTLADSGVLVDDNDPVKISLLANQIITNPTLKQSIISGQNRRLKDFSYEEVKKVILYELQILNA